MQAQPLAPVLNETDQLGDDKTALGGRLRHYQPSPRLKVAVARRADIYPGQIYRWRRELSGSLAGTGFAEVVVTAGPREEGMAPLTGAAIEVEFGGVTRLRIPAATPPELAAAVVGVLRR